MTRTAPWLGSLSVLAAFLAVGWGGAIDTGSVLAALPVPDLGGLHPPSVAAGAALGVSGVAVRKVRWLELPKRALHWFVANQNNLGLGAIAAVCLAVLLFY